MALLKCPECDGNVSSEARACPHCGKPISLPSAKKIYYLSLLFIFFIVIPLFVVLLIILWGQPQR